MFRKVLIANRGEILGRICRTLRDMQISSVAIYSDADRFSPTVLAADEAHPIGPSPVLESYLNIDNIIQACQESGADAVHPGYGFLSERVEFAERLAQAGIRFIGPRPTHLRDFGLKHTARSLAQQAGVPMLPGTGVLSSCEEALAEANKITYPIMLKSSAGGGGIGMALCHDDEDLTRQYNSIAHLAANNFGNASLFLEKYISRARHVEVQIFGDGAGHVVALGTRDCSLQRRHQKVVEETPTPGLSDATLAAMQNAAISLAQSVNYESAGTVEFIYDSDQRNFYFLEVNTRLQVEHGITEEIYGVDLVRWMIEQAAGTLTLPAQSELTAQGNAMEVRIYAENPGNNFSPSCGTLTAFKPGPGLRVDSWVETGTDISAFYDPMLAKFIATGPTRSDALANLQNALSQSEIFGVETNLEYLRSVLSLPDFVAADMTTNSLSAFAFAPRAIEVLEAGAQSSLQSLPGRLGYWEVGIPPSGPMDSLHHDHANMILGNDSKAATLELTHTGPTLRFLADTFIALSGAHMPALLDDSPAPYHCPISVKAGQVLELGMIKGPGQRTYLAISGGFRAPDYLGSTATFALGGFGGTTGQTLQAGDTLRFPPPIPAPTTCPPASQALTREWEIEVRCGPHGAPDFFTDADISTIFNASYEVHHNSARTGVRLIGPRPQWARRDGGEAGLHPSNIHDNAYAVGAVDFTGDMPILLGPDGPSLGGFVCPAVVTKGDLWKLGQLKPGDKLRFVRADTAPAIVSAYRDMVVRRAGDENILIEFGDMKLDFELRLRAQALRDAMAAASIPGIIDLTPGIRSLQVHFDSAQTSTAKMLSAMTELLPSLPAPEDMVVKARTIYLPLSWNDSQIRLAMQKYQETTYPDAPWCPDNIEFIRRINGLENVEDVKNIIFNASYVVLGLGDVYLGAPVATPYDPRHRLVTTKYNPARPWTPQNAVGIGGAYLCVYGMEGPGGYQLFGRTIQVWNTHRQTSPFEDQKPWLLRHFDQIRFTEVSEAELQEARDAFPHGRYPLRIEENQFSLREYQHFCAENAADIEAFQATQRRAFSAERDAWAAKGVPEFKTQDVAPPLVQAPLPPGSRAVDAPVPGSVWRVLVEPGALVQRGEVMMILESMKMEVRVQAPATGRITGLEATPGQTVRAGQRLGMITAEIC